MNAFPYWSPQATMGRVALALAASTCVHAALLANAPIGPGLRELSLLGVTEPLRARLVTPAPAESEASPVQATAPGVAAQPEGATPQSAGASAESAAAGLPAAEIYYRGSEVDERAEPLNIADLVYPEHALKAGVRGVVRLRLRIDHRGVLRDASVLEADPSGVFENAALEAARTLKFRPAFRNGVPVGSIKVIEVPFDPDCKRTGSCVR